MKKKLEIQKLLDSQKKPKKRRVNSFDLAIQLLGVSENNPSLRPKRLAS